jgi:hypothetical protein
MKGPKSFCPQAPQCANIVGRDEDGYANSLWRQPMQKALAVDRDAIRLVARTAARLSVYCPGPGGVLACRQSRRCSRCMSPATSQSI